MVSSLGLCGRPGRLVLSNVTNRNELRKGKRVNVVVETLIDEQSRRLQPKGVWSGKELNIPLRHQRLAVNKERWPHLHNVPFQKLNGKKISVNIGIIPEVFVPLEVCHGCPSRSGRALALLSSVEQVKEQHNSATMFTTSIHQPRTFTSKLNFAGSRSLLALPNLTSP